MPAAPHWPLLTLLAAATAALLRRRVAGDDVQRVVATVVDPGDPPRPTSATVESYAYVGCTDTEIADRFGLSAEEVRRLYAGVLAVGRGKRTFVLRRAQTDLAVEKMNGSMLIWLGRNDLGQTLEPAAVGVPEPVLDPT